MAVSVTAPDGRTLPVDSAELRAELEAKSGQKLSLRYSDPLAVLMIDATASRSGEGSSARPLSQTSGTA